MDLVDEALARLVDDDRQGIQRFLAGLGPGDRAELRGLAVDLVSSFQECFPPLRSAWIPVTESRVRVELFDGAVVLSGKTDLSLGRASGLAANKVIIDLKSGRPSLTHREDLRFYALLETIKLGVPPRQLATYYLESGRAQPEEVTVAMLRSAVRRTIDGVTTMVELRRGDRAAPRPARARPAGGARCGPPASRAWPSWPGGRRWTTTVVNASACRRTRRRRPADDPAGQRAPRAGDGLISATGTPNPASWRTVAIERPGCTAGLGSPMRSPSEARPRRRGRSTVNAMPVERGPGPPAGSGSGPPTTSSTTSPMRKNAWRIGAPPESASRVRRSGQAEAGARWRRRCGRGRAWPRRGGR